MTLLFVFETTHHALWAEEVAADAGLPAEPVPAPAEAGAGCDLALEVLVADADALEAALEKAGVACRRFIPRG
ncbi:MAG: DUF3343 domain-containing protein [Gemmatimonadota bacterium]